MSDKTGIEWTDATWNPFGGCSPLSPGCKPCYAMRLAGTRLKHHPLYAGTTTPSKAGPVFNGTMTVAPDDHDVWSWPLRWKGAKEPKLGAGKPSLIFVGDMADLFHPNRPRRVIDRVFAVITLARRHILQVLTKYPELAAAYIAEERFDEINAEAGTLMHWDEMEPAEDWPPPNLWLGTSVEDAARKPRIDELRKIPAARRFLSLEPLLEDLGTLDLAGIDQVIVGGTSGANARPMHPDWARSLRDQCAAAGVPFFFKQWGEWGLQPSPPRTPIGPHEVMEFGGITVHRFGKKRAGRLLDGVEHNAFPAPVTVT